MLQTTLVIMERQGTPDAEQTIPQGEELKYHSLDEMAKKLAGMVMLAKREGKPLVMALDGMPGLGKTTFVNALVDVLAHENNKVAVIHVDDFLADNDVRYAWKKDPDIDAGTNYNVNNVRHYKFKHEVLIPIALDGELQGERLAYDFATDRDTKIRTDDIEKDAIVIVEGAMAVRSTTEKYYDLTVHLGGPPSLSRKQGLSRNTSSGSDKVQRSEGEMLKSLKRYEDGYAQHVTEHGTLGLHIVIEAREKPDNETHEVEYAFQSVRPLEKISRGTR